MSNPLDLKTVRRLVARLDAPLPPGTSKIHVYPLKHANAEEMLPVLADLIGARTGAGGGGSNGINAPRRDRRPRRDERSGRQSGRSGSAMGERFSPPASPPSQAQAAPSVSGTASEFSSEVSITADPATNSLLISAAQQDFDTLKKVID